MTKWTKILLLVLCVALIAAVAAACTPFGQHTDPPTDPSTPSGSTDDETDKFTVTLDVNGGDALSASTQIVTYGERFSLPVPTRTGYSFNGWYSGETPLTNAQGTGLNVWTQRQNVTLAASWTANKYHLSVRWDLPKAGTVDSIGDGNFLYGSDVQLKAHTNDGFTFVGWFDGQTQLSDKMEFTYTMGTDKTLNVKWIVTPVTTVSADSDAGSVSALEGSYTVGQQVTVTATPNEGYLFDGWYSGDEKLSDRADYTFDMPSQAVTYTAHWRYKHYNITYVYDSDIGDFAEQPPQDYILQGLKLPQAVGKNNDHYSFGWQSQEGIVYEDSLPQGTTGDLTLTAVWGGTHSCDQQGVCTVCGFKRPYIVSEDGKTVTLGSYPQTLVEDNALVSMLNAVAGTLPERYNSRKWTDYGYYFFGEKYSYMWYIDVEYNNAKYRGVYFTIYRPTVTYNTFDGGTIKNGYEREKTYWFRFDPLVWTVLKKDEEQNPNQYMLMSQMALDSMQFTTKTGPDWKAGDPYPNNYKASDICLWLNDNFYNLAFDGDERQVINVTEVDNGASGAADLLWVCASAEQYLCENTFDKIFLLSYDEAKNLFFDKKLGRINATDYAKCQGCLCSELPDASGTMRPYCFWSLRSPSDSSVYACFGDDDSARADNTSLSVNFALMGIVPAINITLI